MYKIANYTELKKEFSEYASWAIWADGETCTDGIGDWSVLTDENILCSANTDYVFVGLNAAEHEQRAEPVPWCNFHSKDIRQRDYKLRCALKDTDYWGAYMTDIIKGYTETDSAKVMAYVKNEPQKYAEHIARFREEMQMLSGDKKPILIAMGNNVYKLLRPLEGEFIIKKITHYAARYKYNNLGYYIDSVHEALKAK